MQVFQTAYCTMVVVAASPAVSSFHLQASELVPLAQEYHQNVELSEYLVSEKLDGIRALWTGAQLITRNGNVIHAPEWFTDNLPDFPLDGELWADRGQFHIVQSTVLDKTPNSNRWQLIRFMVFDKPDTHRNYTERLRALEGWLDRHPSQVIHIVEHHKVSDHQALFSLLDKVTNEGGEGLMLRRALSVHQVGRSDNLLKLKHHQESEVTVVGYKMGKGRIEGMMGALLVKTPQGAQFYVGSGFSDQERLNPPPLGASVTIRYNGLTHNGLPRFPRFLRLRVPE